MSGRLQQFRGQPFSGGPLPSGSGVGGSLLSAAVHSAIVPATREITYQANIAAPNLVIDPTAALRLYHAGALNDRELKMQLGFHGIDWKPAGGKLSSTDRAWFYWAQLSKPSFDLSEYRKWYRQGLVSPAFLKHVLRRHGFGDQAENKLWIDDYNALPLDVLVHLFWAGLITEDEVIQRAVVDGFLPADTRELLKVMRTIPAPIEALALNNRGVIDNDKLDDILKRHGFMDADIRKAYKDLKFTLPSETMLALFSVREVWDDAVSGRFGYDLERPAEYVHFMNMLGYDWSARMPGAAGGGQADLTWPEAHWRAHWRIMSPEQANRAYHMLRGDPSRPDTWRRPGVRPFTLADLYTTLRIQDYAPGVRDALTEIAYLPLRLVDIRNAVYYLRRNRSFAYESFLDRGHRPEDADLQARMAVEIAKRRRDKAAYQLADAGKAQFLKHILEEYELGMIDRDLALGTLVANGMELEDATLALTNVDLGLQESIVKATIVQARKDYFAGRDSFRGVSDRLANAGMNATRVDQLLTKWQIERGQGRIVLSTESALRLMRRGIISYDEAYRRLINLGWANADALLRLTEVQSLMAEDAVKSLKAYDMERRKQAKEIERLIQEQIRRAEKLQAELRRITPLATVLKWFKGQRVSRDWALNRLLAMGYPEDIAKGYLTEGTNASTE